MTDTLTRPVTDQLPEESEPRRLSKKRVVILGIVIGVLLGWALFTITSGPSRAELEQAHWEQVVGYYTEQHHVMTEARAAAEAAHWEDVINHYARQYELMANAPSGRGNVGAANSAPVSRVQADHWQAVVDYYEQQWELGSR